MGKGKGKEPVKAVQNVQESPVENVYRLWGWVALAWAFYRYYFRLPESLDELIFKPLVFVVPVVWFLRVIEKRSYDTLGLTLRNFPKSLLYGVGLGIVLALEAGIANIVKNGSLLIRPIDAVVSYGPLPLVVFTVATATTEEILNRGFLFNRIFEYTNRFVYSALVSTGFFVLLHLPILVTSLHLTGVNLIFYFVTTAVLGVTNCILFSSTKSLVAPVIVHIIWNLTVAFLL